MKTVVFCCISVAKRKSPNHCIDRAWTGGIFDICASKGKLIDHENSCCQVLVILLIE